jgi:hypothetical protein
VLALGAGAFCFLVVFPALLQPEKRDAPWPATAFGRCLALWWFLTGVLFLALFAVASDELKRPGWRLMPAGPLGNFVNLHWLWMLAAAVTVAGAWVIHWRFRHHERAAD